MKVFFVSLITRYELGRIQEFNFALIQVAERKSNDIYQFSLLV